MMAYDYPHPVSRTYQYKKITKPLLERKRRARINRCLDELKDLMVDALETEGENISKLEKADILELTVRHLQRLHASRPSGLTAGLITNDDSSGESRWQSGFGHCAAEACKYLAALPGESGEKLARHLASGLQSTRKLNIQIMPKDELLSPALVSSDANSQSHSPEIPLVSTASSSAAVKIPPLPRSTSLPDEESIEPPNKKLCNSPLKKNESMASMVSEDDEEIDVERVDERDPMWRPW